MSVPLFERVPGIRLEWLEDYWLGYSPASGGTMVLNGECAAVLEVLSDAAADSATVAAALAHDTGMPAQDLEATIERGWTSLIQAGLVRQRAPQTA